MSIKTPIEGQPMAVRVARVNRAVSLRNRETGEIEIDSTDDWTPADEVTRGEFLRCLERYRAGEKLHPDEMELLTECMGSAGLSAGEGDAEAALENARAARRFLQFCFSGRPDPGYWLRNLIALAQVFAPELLRRMTNEDLAVMLGETRAANAARQKKLDDYGRALGAKGAGHREAARKAAKGNHSRAIGTPPRPSGSLGLGISKQS